MKKLASVIAIAALFSMAVPAWTYAAEKAAPQGKSEKKKSDKEKKVPGTGPMGEEEKSGSGPSGPQSTAPGKAPGFEGEASKKGGKPTNPGMGQ